MMKSSSPRQCPNCHSRDIWRWHREKGSMRWMASLLNLSLMTCRGCGGTFYCKATPKRESSAAKTAGA